ncbi:MAG: hypothetical protein ACKOEX_08835 [Planctomycetia bacterium]
MKISVDLPDDLFIAANLLIYAHRAAIAEHRAAREAAIDRACTEV